MNWRAPLIYSIDKYLKRTNIYNYMRLIKDYRSLQPEKQFGIQQERLIKILLYASQHNYYYRGLLEEYGVVTSNSKVNLDRFCNLPILTKEVINEHFDGLKSDQLVKRRWYYNSTGGSTGEPLRFIQDREYSDASIASIYLDRDYLNVKIGERVIKLWGSQKELMEGSYGLRAQIMSLIRNTYFLNCFRMSEEDMSNYIKHMQANPPALLTAYVDGVYELASYMNRNNLKITGLKGIITGAGTLRPSMREEIEAAFDCKVYNRYGSREMGNMAMDDHTHKQLSINTYTHLIELINSNGDYCQYGEEGEIIVTCLTNCSMPLIRYKIGDTAIVKDYFQEPLYSTFSFSQVTGRVMDSFVRRDGTVVSAVFFIHFIGVAHKLHWVKKVQIIQSHYDQVVVKLVTTHEPPVNDLKELTHSLKLAMGDECNIEYQFVDELPPSESGKYRYTISHVPRP